MKTTWAKTYYQKLEIQYQVEKLAPNAIFIQLWFLINTKSQTPFCKFIFQKKLSFE